MKRLSRTLLTAAGGLVIALVSAAGVQAAGLITPGHFSTNIADGNAYWYSTANAQISVSRDTFIFRPSHNGGPANMYHATLLFVSIDTSTFSGSDCFQIPDLDFVESYGVQSASLNAYVDASNLCPGFATPVDAALSGAGCGKGCPPPPVPSIPLPMTVSITWSGNGVTTSSTSSAHFMCAGFNSAGESSDKSAYGSATGTLTFYDGVTAPVVLAASDFASVDQGTFQADNQGTVDPRCFGGV
jgi:hypothetical protein